jgi:hypothetical protein
MATNLELRLLKLERQQSEQLRQQSAPALDVFYIDAGEGAQPEFAYSVVPQPRVAATNLHRDRGAGRPRR